MQQLEYWPVSDLIEYARNPRKNDHAVDKVAALGILIDEVVKELRK